ncbi:MAG: glutamyl-tRNA reductase [Sarcina sp.]
MIVLVGVKKSVNIEIREKLSIAEKDYKEYLNNLLEVFDEAVIINTCNRTEIYVNSDKDFDFITNKIFEILNWNKNLKDSCFIFEEKRAVRHLFEVTSGFHSKITGEDQILGQVKDAFKKAEEEHTVNSVLNRLFQNVIGCGKKFRTESKLYEIPVSSASIVANKIIEANAKKIILIGFGDVGKKIYKYIENIDIDNLIIIVRNIEKIKYLENEKIKVMTYNDAEKFLNKADVIISATSSMEIVLRKEHIEKIGNKISVFDLAVPRDVDEEIRVYERVELANIDEISKLDDKNKISRKKRMYQHKHIVNEAIDEFNKWLDLREISKEIMSIRKHSDQVVKARCDTFYNKSKVKTDIKLANQMIKSTASVYTNKAIEVLKAEKLKGNEEECLRILRMIFN